MRLVSPGPNETSFGGATRTGSRASNRRVDCFAVAYDFDRFVVTRDFDGFAIRKDHEDFPAAVFSADGCGLDAGFRGVLGSGSVRRQADLSARVQRKLTRVHRN